MSILGMAFLVKLLIYYNKVNEHMVPLTKETLLKYYDPADRVAKTACKLYLNYAMACKC